MAEKTKIEKVTDAAKKLASPLASLLGKQETIKPLKKKKEKEQVYHSRDGTPYLKSKVGEKIHKATQEQKQEAYAPKSPRNELAKGGRAGYSVGGKAIRGVSKILIK